MMVTSEAYYSQAWASIEITDAKWGKIQEEREVELPGPYF